MLATLSSAPELPVLQAQVQFRLGLDSATATGAVGELAKFLELCSRSNEPLAPSVIVDEVWHVFILHTRLYASYCQEQFGLFIHHSPGADPQIEAYARTLDCLSARFGQPDPYYWPAASAKCGRACNDGP